MSAPDAIQDFIGAMESAGMKPLEPIAGLLSSGKSIRFRCEGDKPGRKNGWAVLHLDERPAGAFGHYRLGLARTWKSGDTAMLTEAERARLRREWAQAKRNREIERESIARWTSAEARAIWSRSKAALPKHPYVERKRLDPGPLRQQGDLLLVPMFDITGELWNLQRIAPDGTKRFLKGGRVEGLFNYLGDPDERIARGATCCIGEGYATMAAVHRSTFFPCIVAFSAKNMAGVARHWKQARPDLDFVICADDDCHLPRNVGVESATVVALEIGARLAIPRSPHHA